MDAVSFLKEKGVLNKKDEIYFRGYSGKAVGIASLLNEFLEINVEKRTNKRAGKANKKTGSERKDDSTED